MTTVLGNRLLTDVLGDVLVARGPALPEYVPSGGRAGRTSPFSSGGGSSADSAAAYAVVAYRASAEGAAAEILDSLQGKVDAIVPDGGDGGHLLLPCEPDRHAALARELYDDVGVDAWMAVVWAPREDLVSACAVAEDVLRIASCRAPGVYELRDVLAEFAVLRRPHVAEKLAGMFEPVAARQPLLDAVRAILAEEGNRAAASRRLGIHRSTLDHRLRTVERLMGCRAVSPSGLLTLSVALSARSPS
ncbi:helix-turn-helix domain-containing protein [Lentzea albida]|uniref:PucR C-terminal helix-turn-helix domain-containing protein n=1 Tax=Lentzea albida TaxID=65499 RepID=A0A1H9WU00_9PSEU|nr:helix-turn-helix domain-containing protein [Lentzea albida]SES37259.1 PucR C-terminal helix-turn-helix domain-containing protein [Lentzea albida]